MKDVLSIGPYWLLPVQLFAMSELGHGTAARENKATSARRWGHVKKRLRGLSLQQKPRCFFAMNFKIALMQLLSLRQVLSGGKHWPLHYFRLWPLMYSGRYWGSSSFYLFFSDVGRRCYFIWICCKAFGDLCRRRWLFRMLRQWLWVTFLSPDGLYFVYV